MSYSKEGKWIARGWVTASECFGCRNKLGHRVDEGKVFILCRDNCNYHPLDKDKVKGAEDEIKDNNKETLSPF
jgi:hypothetical protein